MDKYDHAQQIFSLLLMARPLSKQPFPAGQELDNLAASARIYAHKFAEVYEAETNKQKS